MLWLSIRWIGDAIKMAKFFFTQKQVVTIILLIPVKYSQGTDQQHLRLTQAPLLMNRWPHRQGCQQLAPLFVATFQVKLDETIDGERVRLQIYIS